MVTPPATTPQVRSAAHDGYHQDNEAAVRLYLHPCFVTDAEQRQKEAADEAERKELHAYLRSTLVPSYQAIAKQPQPQPKPLGMKPFFLGG